ncbi:hypothetical protein LEN26_018737 [Aphanomyces euteiches]|nr:hypothetical protein LEN26_018737 [Aphanomyces euteiches]KAH9129258.1 hypothetical protein AeMF1_000681 [Aphanomyces euteiches]KAH9195566.1 hypothetical protein AeNC1_002446 [Aphanomyces euteiches]
MVNYFIFLALFLTVVIQTTSGDDMFKLSRLIKANLAEMNFQLTNTSVYKSYNTIDNVDELYEYMVGPFWDAIYGGNSFDGDSTFPEGSLYGGRGYLGGVGRILGKIRLGQVRVDPIPCENLAPNGISTCLPEYSSSTASTTSFGLGHELYEPVEEHIDEPSYISITNRVYPGPAFAVELPNIESSGCDAATKVNCAVWHTLEELRENKFWDLATRAIFIDLNVYNPHCDVVAVVRLFLEQTDGGGLTSTATIRPFRPYSMFKSGASVGLIVECVLYLVVLHHASVAFRRVRTVGIKYYAVRANIVNDINIVFFFVVLALRVLIYTSLPHEFNDEEYINLRSSANYDYMARGVNSVNCFLSVLKVFKYLSFIPTFRVLTSTVSGAVEELMGLFVMIAILLFGGSLAFTIAFGTLLRHYSVLINSFYALMGIFTLKFDAEEIYDGNRVLGPLFFLCFVSLIILVIMHMLIACFANAYIQQKESYLHAKEMKLQTLGADILDHILHNILFTTPVLGPRIFRPLYRYYVSVMKHSSGGSRESQISEANKRNSIQVKSAQESKKIPDSTARIHPIADASPQPNDPPERTSQDAKELHEKITQIDADFSALVKDVEKRLRELEKSSVSAQEVHELAAFLNSLNALEDDLRANLQK